jgi:hypothetical protein
MAFAVGANGKLDHGGPPALPLLQHRPIAGEAFRHQAASCRALT